MTASIDGQQLALVNRLLDLPSSSLTGLTTIDDGNVSQVIDIGAAILRRGLTPVASTGLFIAIMENVHSGADSETTTVDPYSVGTLAVGGYPAAVDAQLTDVWISDVMCIRTSGAGELNSAQLRLNTVGGPVNPQGWGVDDSGAFIAGTDGPVLAMWIGNAVSTGGGSQVNFPEAGTGKASAIQVNRRIRPGESMVFSSASTAAADFQLVFTIGLFPAGLGQDILG